MPDRMMALGAYRFAVATAAYQSLRRSAEWRWVSVDRVSREPAQQYVGPGAEAIDIDGVIFPHHRGGIGQVAAMRAEAGKGAPLLLVSGTGEHLGRWVILSIEETGSVFAPAGVPRRIEFRMALRRYGEDEA